jgi:hypothetical protein
MTSATLTAPLGRSVADAKPATWELDRSRCAVETSLALPGATIWRARLRPLAARITGSSLTANVSAKLAKASLPLTRPLFLRGTARTLRVWVEADAGEFAGELVGLRGEVAVASRSWPAEFALRRTSIGDDRILVEVVGRVLRPVRGLALTQLRVEAVGEFVRCD